MNREKPKTPEDWMVPDRQVPFVLSPKLVLYSDEKLVSPRLQRVAAMIPCRPGETRPPGEDPPKGIRRIDGLR